MKSDEVLSYINIVKLLFSIFIIILTILFSFLPSSQNIDNQCLVPNMYQVTRLRGYAVTRMLLYN